MSNNRMLFLDVICPDELKRRVRSSIRKYRELARKMAGAYFAAQAAGCSVETCVDDITLIPENERASLILGTAFDMESWWNPRPEKWKPKKDEVVLFEGKKWTIIKKLKKMMVEIESSDGVKKEAKIKDLAPEKPFEPSGEKKKVQDASPMYALRDQIKTMAPEYKGFVFDSMRKQSWERWIAKDPQFTNCTRGFLMLNFSRELVRFKSVGIEFPVLTAKPVLDGRKIGLFWDTNLGRVEFELPNLDNARWITFCRIRDGQSKLGTVVLSEKEGKIRIGITYSIESLHAEVDSDRHLDVKFEEDKLAIVGPDGTDTCEFISYEEAVAWLARVRKVRDIWQNRQKCAGSKRRHWGARKIFVDCQEKVSRNTDRRTNGVKYRNHHWSRLVIDRARKWRCGSIRITTPEKSEICGHPWAMDQFKQFVKYKANLYGIELVK